MEFFLFLGGIAWAVWYFGKDNSIESRSGANTSLENVKLQSRKTTDRSAAPSASDPLRTFGDGQDFPVVRQPYPTISVTGMPSEARPLRETKQQMVVSTPALLKRGPQAFAFCSLDTETTGIVPRSRRHRAFEISCVRFTPKSERSWSKRRFTRYVKVDTTGMKGLKLSPMWETHVSTGGQKEAVDATVALSDLRDFVRDLPLVCHNASFDKCVIENEIEKVAYRWRPENKWICTLRMARSGRLGRFVGYSPGRDDGMSYKLEHVANALDLSLDPHQLHLGHYDAEVAGNVFVKLHHVRTVPIWYL